MGAAAWGIWTVSVTTLWVAHQWNANGAFQSFLVSHSLRGWSPYGSPNTGVCINRFDEFERASGLGVWAGE